ncbi:MAG TPA: hypothetical protein VFZ53_29015 [Polyangiaceae bacterium]
MICVASTARARPEFAAAVGTDLGICTPPCTLCHTGTPNKDNVERPFVLNLIDFADRFDLPGVRVSTIPKLLELMETVPCGRAEDPACATDPCDFCNSDGSRAPDVAELREQQDPNSSGSFVCPEYGCGARVAPVRDERLHDAALAGIALALAAAMVARRRASGG